MTYLLGGLTAAGLGFMLGCGKKKEGGIETDDPSEERLEPREDGTYPSENQGEGREPSQEQEQMPTDGTI